MVPPYSDRISRVPPYSWIPLSITFITCTGLSPSMARLSRPFRFCMHKMSWSYNPSTAVTARFWAVPRSLATTLGISVDFFSSGYLDVSVPRVRLSPMFRCSLIVCRNTLGFPIRTSPDQGSMFPPSPQLFAAYHVLHRL